MVQSASALRIFAACVMVAVVLADNPPATGGVKRLYFEATSVQNYPPLPNGSSANGYRYYLGYNDQQIVDELLRGLDFYNTTFGVPKNTYTALAPGYPLHYGLYVPGYGSIVPIEFNTSVPMVAKVNVDQGPSRLGFAEVPFFVTQPFEYGGAYRTWLDTKLAAANASPAEKQAATTSTTQDFFSFGYYIVRRTGDGGQDLSSIYDRKFRVRTLFPANQRPNGIFAEVTDVYDIPPTGGVSWGRGETATIIQSDAKPVGSGSSYLTKMKFSFSFPDQPDRYAFYGLTSPAPLTQ